MRNDIKEITNNPDSLEVPYQRANHKGRGSFEVRYQRNNQGPSSFEVRYQRNKKILTVWRYLSKELTTMVVVVLRYDVKEITKNLDSFAVRYQRNNQRFW